MGPKNKSTGAFAQGCWWKKLRDIWEKKGWGTLKGNNLIESLLDNLSTRNWKEMPKLNVSNIQSLVFKYLLSNLNISKLADIV